MMDTRKKRILRNIDVSKQTGLEIGPLATPIVSKKEGAIYYLDHMSTEELKEKYQKQKEWIDTEKIVDIDYALKGRNLPKTAGNKKFDYILASHVIEHVPDTVRWLEEVYAVLKPGGILSLVIPDKRYTFDHNRQISVPADVVGAYLDKYTRPSSAMVYDYAREHLAELNAPLAWQNPKKYAATPKRWDQKVIDEKCRSNLANEYVDGHWFVHTPGSFVEILRELMKLDLIKFEVSHFIPTFENELEFYVGLRKIDPKKVSIKKRLATLPKVRELTEEEKEIAALRKELKATLAAKASAEQQITDLKNSTSWRVTKGLRKASEKARKIRHGKS